MSNVLPRDAQKMVWRVYRARYILAGSYVALAGAAIAALMLLPMYLALHAAPEVHIPESSSGVKNSELQKERVDIARAQYLISTLAPFATASASSSEAVSAALALRPKGVTVDHISYTSGATGQIMLVGMASGRDVINAYRQALQADNHFKIVSVPVGDLAGTQGGRFSVSLLGNF